jgi:hypothetical protein
MPPSRTELFDAAMKTVTQERGAVYGHPLDDFRRANALTLVAAECRHPAVRHALQMICVKLARLIETPDHVDSVIDIAGYARCILMALDEEEGRNE